MDLVQVAGLIGVRLADRVAEESFYWDGRSVATLARAGAALEPHHVLHEVCHWIVATEAERALPEWGMVPRAASISGQADPSGRRAYEERVRATMPRETRNLREAAAQVVNKFLGKELGILSVFGWDWDRAESAMKTVSPNWESKGTAWLEERGIRLDGLLTAEVWPVAA